MIETNGKKSQRNQCSWYEMMMMMIGPMNRTLTSTTTLGQSGPGSNDNEVYSSFPTDPNRYLFSVISRKLVEETMILIRKPLLT